MAVIPPGCNPVIAVALTLTCTQCLPLRRNIVEIILSIAALQKGLYTVVAASLLGSILSNLLLVLGEGRDGSRGAVMRAEGQRPS